MKKVNVITAAYDCPAWIFDYLNGWNSQNRVNGWDIEIMIGVDGCEKTHQALVDRNISHYWSADNVGTYIIANSLHALSNANLYIRFDADDVPLPTYLSAAIENLTKSKCFQFLEYRTDENLKPIKKHNKSNTMVYTKEVLEKIGGFHPVRVGADKDFIGRARSAGFTGGNPLGHHFYKRQHKNALTRAKETNMKSVFRKECHELMKKHIGYYVEPVTVELQKF